MRRQRGSSSLRAAPGSRDWTIVVALVAVALILGTSALAFFRGGGTLPYQGMQGSRPGGWIYVSNSQLSSTGQSQPAAASNDTLTFQSDSLHILVLMGPMTEGESMYSFVIDNLTNPTLVIPYGATVTMTVVNVDTDAYHALMLTTAGPPYPYNFMPMMMSPYASTNDLPPSSSSGFAEQQVSFTANGDAYYLCPVPGHAQSGMYGLIEVS